MRRSSILSDAIFGLLTGIPIAIVWFLFGRLHLSLFVSLVLGLALGPSGAVAAALSHYLISLAPNALRARVVSYALSAALGIAVAYPAFWLLLALYGRPWIMPSKDELLAAAATSLLSSYIVQRRMADDISSNTTSGDNPSQ